jgi:hypothetical protein
MVEYLNETFFFLNCLECRKNHVIPPEKGLLAFLWYMSKQDTLLSIADRFNLVSSTVMHLVNAFLYVLLQLNGKYIFWPKTQDEYQVISNGFTMVLQITPTL